MDGKVGNLEVFIKKKTNAYCRENVTVKITSRAKPHKSYSSITNDGIHSKHMAKFTNIPLGFYDLEALCKGYVYKKECVQVKFSGEDTHWNGSFRKSRNRKQIEIVSMLGRNMTAGEKTLATTVYKTQINFNKVKIFNRKWTFLQPKTRAMAPNGNIYYPAENSDYSVDFSTEGVDIHKKATFIHELAHVWQH